MQEIAEQVPELRIRAGETNEQIASEIARCADIGVIVCYFNDLAALHQWRERVAALA